MFWCSESLQVRHHRRVRGICRFSSEKNLSHLARVEGEHGIWGELVTLVGLFHDVLCAYEGLGRLAGLHSRREGGVAEVLLLVVRAHAGGVLYKEAVNAMLCWRRRWFIWICVFVVEEALLVKGSMLTSVDILRVRLAVGLRHRLQKPQLFLFELPIRVLLHHLVILHD